MTVSQSVTVSAGQTAFAALGPVVTNVCRAALTVQFPTAKSFIAPDQKPAIEQAFAIGLEPSGGGPVPDSDLFMLIIGHTDKVGSQSSNQTLSKRRARAALAVFTIDAAQWETLFNDESWGAAEIGVMAGEVDPPGPANPLYLTDATLRLDLMERYIKSLRPDWVPAKASPIQPQSVSVPVPPIVGCGEDLPITGGTNQQNRRVEFFFFEVSDPGIADEDDCPPEAVYDTWQLVCGQFFTAELEIQNEYGEPHVGDFTLTLPTGGVIRGTTDATGRFQRDNLPGGLYKLKVKGRDISELPDGGVSVIEFEKLLTVADRSIRVQVIDLTKWFIPVANATTTIPRFSRGNTVEALVDGRAAMAAMHAAFTAATGDANYIYLMNWRMDADVAMLGASTTTADVIPVLIAAMGRRVEVRAMLWDQAGTQNTDEQEEIDDETRTPVRGQAILDNETLNFGSHHQKAAVVNGPNGLVGFCGGIDLATERWDEPGHRVPNPDRDAGDPKPWHDVHTRIRGPAAGHIETNFRERWNNHPQKNDNGRTDVLVHPVPPPIATATHLVQTLRTFPPQQAYPFAPTGELGSLNGLLNAISNAREYIYIEDQYLVSEDVRDALVPVLPGLRGRLIIVVNLEPDDPFPAPDAILFHRVPFINALTAAAATKVEVYHLVNRRVTPPRNIFVHAKVAIVDDIWAKIGSSNVNRRSLTHDSEIDVTVIDGRLEGGRRKFARDFRIDLWTEHLNVGRSTVEDPIAGAARWAPVAAAGTGNIDVYPMPPGSDSITWNSIIDPDGR